MNLHGIVAPYIGAVNPQIPVEVLISTGPGEPSADGSEVPGYATPGSITASLADDILTVSAIASGSLQIGQTLSDLTSALAPGTAITGQLSGPVGGIGTYTVNRGGQAVGSETMTTALILIGQVQPITTDDLRQLDGVNLGGVKWKIYLNGEIDSVVRPERKGGDLVKIATGRHQGTWLVVQILEQWPDWCVGAIVQQNGS